MYMYTVLAFCILYVHMYTCNVGVHVFFPFFSYLERLAYDWITHKVYWSDYGAAEIGIVDLQSGNRMVLIETGQKQHSRPRALELDPIRR